MTTEPEQNPSIVFQSETEPCCDPDVPFHTCGRPDDNEPPTVRVGQRWKTKFGETFTVINMTRCFRVRFDDDGGEYEWKSVPSGIEHCTLLSDPSPPVPAWESITREQWETDPPAAVLIPLSVLRLVWKRGDCEHGEPAATCFAACARKAEPVNPALVNWADVHAGKVRPPERIVVPERDCENRLRSEYDRVDVTQRGNIYFMRRTNPRDYCDAAHYDMQGNLLWYRGQENAEPTEVSPAERVADAGRPSDASATDTARGGNAESVPPLQLGPYPAKCPVHDIPMVVGLVGGTELRKLSCPTCVLVSSAESQKLAADLLETERRHDRLAGFAAELPATFSQGHGARVGRRTW